MTLPTAQNCDVVITTASNSNTAASMMMTGSGPQVASSTGLPHMTLNNNTSGSNTTTDQEVELKLMDLMMTATPLDGGDQARMSATTNDDNNNEITMTPTSGGEEDDEDVVVTIGRGTATKIIPDGSSSSRQEHQHLLRPSCQMQQQQSSPPRDNDDDSDMFGPPRSTPLLNSNRPRVPMISAKLRLREERKRILQLCANKLEKIKDSETNLRRSVCINNTYSRLTEEVRREKQSRYLANLPK